MGTGRTKPGGSTRALRRFRSRVKFEQRIRKALRWKNEHRVERDWDAEKRTWGPSTLIAGNTVARRAEVRAGECCRSLHTSGKLYSRYDSYSKVEAKTGHLAARRLAAREIRREVAELHG